MWPLEELSVPVDVRPDDVSSAAAQWLFAALDAEMDALYPEDGANFLALDPVEVAPGRGVFLLAYVEGDLVGCGALRCLDLTTGELKRMFVCEPARGQGVGRAVLAGLEAVARDLGLRTLVLETGDRATDTVAFYTRAGFRSIPKFGDYVAGPSSICMAKDLSSGHRR